MPMVRHDYGNLFKGLKGVWNLMKEYNDYCCKCHKITMIDPETVMYMQEKGMLVCLYLTICPKCKEEVSGDGV